MEKYEEMKKLIIKAGDEVNFSDFGNGVSEEWIIKAEKRLNVIFPESYKWWLRNYGGGEIRGEEIYSIYEIDFDTVVGGDIVYINEINRRQQGYTNDMIVISESFDEIFYLDAFVGSCIRKIMELYQYRICR